MPLIFFTLGLGLLLVGALIGSEHAALEYKVNACSAKGGLYLEDKCYKVEELK